MPDITNELTEILSAERGEDVRMSIYRGLQKISNESASTTTLVDVLNAAITGQTGTNVQAFIDSIDELIDSKLYYHDGDTVMFEDCESSFYMIPGTAATVSVGGEAGFLLDFSLELPKSFKPITGSYTITLTDLTIDSLIYIKNNPYVDTGEFDVVVEGAKRTGFTLARATNTNNLNRLHFEILGPGTIAYEKGLVLLSVSKLGFTVAESST